MKKCLLCDRSTHNPKVGFLCERHEQKAIDIAKKAGGAMVTGATILVTAKNITNIKRK